MNSRTSSLTQEAQRRPRLAACLRELCRKHHWTPEMLAKLLQTDLQYAHALLDGRVFDIPRAHVRTLVHHGASWSELADALDGANRSLPRRVVELLCSWFGLRRRQHHTVKKMASLQRRLDRANAEVRSLHAEYRRRQKLQHTTTTTAVDAASSTLSAHAGIPLTPSFAGSNDADPVRDHPRRHACLNCGNNLVTEPQTLEQAIMALTAEHRSKLRLVFLSAQVGYMTLLSEDPEFREQQISLCRQLDRVINNSLSELDRRDVNEARRSYWTILNAAVRRGSIELGHGEVRSPSPRPSQALDAGSSSDARLGGEGV
jgi:hypothetical protein